MQGERTLNCPAALLAGAVLVTVAGWLSVAVYPPGASQPDEVWAAGRRLSLAALPMAFEANRGQAVPEVKFVSRGAGYALFLTAGEAVLSLRGPDGRAGAVRMRLLGARAAPPVEGLEELPGRSNYFIGNDSARWRSGVPRYARARYRSVYPGVDLLFYGRERRLEYDFVVAPGADPMAIRMAYEGVERMELSSEGDLVLGVAGGEIRQHRPAVYQDAEGARRKVDGAYVLGPGRQVAFRVGAYDSSRPLVIDPVLDYSTYLGGAGAEMGYAIAVDATGNAYAAGYTESVNLPTVNATQGSLGGGRDAFVFKLERTGAALVWATYLGGAASDTAYSLQLDAAGNVLVAGETASPNFPVVKAFQTTYGGGEMDGFLAKLNAAGGALEYSTYFGGSLRDQSRDLAVDSSGQTYLTGYTDSANLPTLRSRSRREGREAFVAKFNPAASALVFSTYLGGGGTDAATDVAVDSAGNIYLSGYTNSNDFPTASAAQGASGGPNDVFVAKLKESDLSLVYSTYLGGSGDDAAFGLAVDAAGNAHVTGYTESGNFPTTAALQPAKGAGRDAFIAKLAASGALVYATYLGGNEGDSANEIVVGPGGDAYVAGWTVSTDFPTANAVQREIGRLTAADAFLTIINPAGSALVFSTYLGGSGTDQAGGMAVDTAGNAYLTGQTTSSQSATRGAFQTTYGGQGDFFVAKIGFGVTPVSPLAALSAASYAGNAVAPDSLVAAYGQGLSTVTEVATAVPLPTVLAGTSVRVSDSAGAERLAPLIFVSPGQINLILPAQTALGPATLTVSCGDRVVASGTVRVEAVAPGLISANGNGRGVAAAVAQRVARDGTQGSQLVFQCAAAGNCTGVPIELGGETDQAFLLLFGTGIRGRSSLPAVSVTIAGERAEVLSAGAQGEYAGLDQVNVRLARSLVGRGEVNVALTVDGKAANTVTVRIGGTPPPTPPRITALTPNSGEAGQTVAEFKITGENLSGVTSIEFSPPGGISISSLRAASTSVTAPLAIDAAAAPGERSVAASSPAGRSNALVFTVKAKPSGQFVISNLRAGPAVTTSAGLSIPVVVDFEDPSGSAASDAVRVNFDINNKNIAGFTTLRPEGVTPGQTKGTMRLPLFFDRHSAPPGLTLPIVVWLTNQLGVDSNRLSGTFQTQ